MKKKLIALLLALATLSAFAQTLPNMKDKYVTDAADILSRSELKQLRSDVKSMCDYYSTRIVVGIVPTFGDYEIDEYAGELAEKWELSDENTMLILVKPKSDEERGEAMLLASSDLEDVFTSDVCDNIVHDQMIPHFKTDDYFGGIEAALEYMNKMSTEEGEDDAAVVDPSDNKEKSGSGFWEGLKSFGGLVGLGALTIVKWVLILCVIVALVCLVLWLIKRKKNNKDDGPSRFGFFSDGDTDDVSMAVMDKKLENEKRKRKLEELKRLERESQELDGEYDNIQERGERRSRRGYDDYDDYDEYDGRRTSRSLEDSLGNLSQVAEGKGMSVLGTVGKVAVGVAGAAVVGKMVKDRMENKKDDDGGLLSNIGSVFKKKEADTSNAPSRKLKLGGSGKSKASSGNKPKLGGSGSKSKPGGNTSSGGW